VNPHQLGESIPLQGVNFFLLSDPSLPSFWWLLTGLHLMIHPLYHALDPNRQLPIELIILHLLQLLRSCLVSCGKWMFYLNSSNK